MGKTNRTQQERVPAPEEPRPIWEQIQEVMSKVPKEELKKWPKDGAAEHDHYIYGLPKRKK